MVNAVTHSGSSSQAVGERIKYYRLKKKMTQKELGEACGIDAANIRKYESGRQNAKIETLEKIADALGVGIGKLYGLELIDKIIQVATPEAVELAERMGQLAAQDDSAQKQSDELNDAFSELNYEGREEAIKRVRELTKLRQYSYCLYDEAEHTAKLVAHAVVEETKQAEMENRGLSEEKLAFMFRQMMLGEWTPPTDDQQKTENSQDAAGDAPKDTEHKNS